MIFKDLESVYYTQVRGVFLINKSYLYFQSSAYKSCKESLYFYFSKKSSNLFASGLFSCVCSRDSQALSCHCIYLIKLWSVSCGWIGLLVVRDWPRLFSSLMLGSLRLPINTWNKWGTKSLQNLWQNLLVLTSKSNRKFLLLRMFCKQGVVTCVCDPALEIEMGGRSSSLFSTTVN